jgi:L,D-transpeptidase ErfK/SrfK
MISPLDTFVVREDITVREYFPFMDSLVAHWNIRAPFPVSEHLIVHANPWILDTLRATDYYFQMEERDSFVYDQRRLRVLFRGDSLFLPRPETADSLLDRIRHSRLVINIPAYRLWALSRSDTLFSCLVRVGRNEKKYLEMSGRITDLRTLPGKGKIVRINRFPRFINPANCRPYEYTRRDDGRLTKTPLIPWIEPEIEGVRHGHLIHPTTNPETLGKAYSNGCIGVGEADMWQIYYYAPLGTEVHIQYDLDTWDAEGNLKLREDIYGWGDRD